jgi:hypothetical protein
MIGNYNNNSIQFNSLLFMCRVNSHRANNNNNNNNNDNTNLSYNLENNKNNNLLGFEIVTQIRSVSTDGFAGTKSTAFTSVPSQRFFNRGQNSPPIFLLLDKTTAIFQQARIYYRAV